MSSLKQASSGEFNLRVGLCQTMVGPDKVTNLNTARTAVKEASKKGAQLVVLPECFNCIYDTSSFHLYQEPIPDVSSTWEQISSLQESCPTTFFLSSLAKELNVYLIGGSYPEQAAKSVTEDGEERSGTIYNTSTVFDPSGTLIAKHRKVHLFDIDIPGKITFKESLTLSPGNSFTTFKIPSTYFESQSEAATGPAGGVFRDLTIGLGICYDIRFAEYAQICRQKYGADILVYPGAFNTVTGPAHWKFLQIARSLDNQVYTIACSPARNPDSAYQAYGHSSIISPWGETVAMATETPAVVVDDLNINRITEIRTQIPISIQRRADLYSVDAVSNPSRAGIF